MIEKLKEYASQLGFEDIVKKLNIISSSLQDSKAQLVLPLIGEFSAGKTTLINAISDSKALESASEPTTATIYALHFGATTTRAIIHNQDGTITETDKISELHNKDLIDTTIVEVFDTSSNSLVLELCFPPTISITSTFLIIFPFLLVFYLLHHILFYL